jgi:hypothetical protein
MITHYVEEFNNQILGKYDISRFQAQKSEISIGARVKILFENLYKNFLNLMAT